MQLPSASVGGLGGGGLSVTYHQFITLSPPNAFFSGDSGNLKLMPGGCSETLQEVYREVGIKPGAGYF